MKNKPNIALIAILIATVQFGCQSPNKTVYGLGTTMNLADDAMIAAYEAKKIDREKLAYYVDASRAAHAAIAKLNEARLSGDTAKVEDLLRVASAEVAKAAIIRLNALGESK